MSKKQSYTFIDEWWMDVQMMDIQERGIVFTAICERVFESKASKNVLPEYKQRVLDKILQNIEKQIMHASEVSRKRSQAGSAGMGKRWNKMQNNANADNKCYDSDNKCYPSRARFHHQQHNNYLEDIDNNNYINNNNLEDNNYLDNNNEETKLREKIEGWLTDSCVRMEQLCKNNGLISSSKTNDELVKILKPYIDKFINHLLASKPTEHIDRKDTINHFANWIRIHKKQQDDGTPKYHIPTDDEYNEPF